MGKEDKSQTKSDANQKKSGPAAGKFIPGTTGRDGMKIGTKEIAPREDAEGGKGAFGVQLKKSTPVQRKPTDDGLELPSLKAIPGKFIPEEEEFVEPVRKVPEPKSIVQQEKGEKPKKEIKDTQPKPKVEKEKSSTDSLKPKPSQEKQQEDDIQPM